ncbi:hypothetical protein [Methylomonas rivi]|uniref:Uncharacterized protein n=1 Tax=Methylomonas rivi TaxID=2952226 RepID=A0ABT1U767_9GAMM|nr:hypothetical protein [Methylomonas sp. WSC-6]MCQ8129706.1 hypothetical protein [Methylomonas sp. WSC-6]
MEEDKQLERLYDYTKFHIGIYLSAGGGLAALISTAAEGNKAEFIKSLIGMPQALVLSFVFMVLAATAGAIVATSTIESSTFQSFMESKQGAYGFKVFYGKTWVSIEHACFWISLLWLAIAIFSAEAVKAWVFGCH